MNIEKLSIEEQLYYVRQEIAARAGKKAKDSYLDYVIYTHGGIFVPNRHAVLICNTLNKYIQRSKMKESNIICISMPPQHGKSMTVTETLPSYFLGRNPDANALIISYNQSSARIFGRKNRLKIQRYGEELFGIKLNRAQSSVVDFGLEGHTGSIFSEGLGGSITGKSGGVIIFDDPYKSGKEARSPVIRKTIEDLYEEAVETRIHPGTLIIVIHTRWHQDDLIGFLNKKYGKRIINLVLQAECENEQTDLLNRKLGEFLWEEHHGKQYYLDKKKNKRVWSALYQQRPSPIQGAIFNKSAVRLYNKEDLELTSKDEINLSKFRYLCMFWDTAFKNNPTSDYVAGQIWGWLNGDYYCLYRFKERLDWVDTHDKIYIVIKRFPQARKVLIEDSANGIGISNSLWRKYKIRTELVGTKGKSKEARALEVSDIFNDGHVLLPADDIGVDEMLDEIGNFPFAKHDDEVDAMVGALSYISGKVKGINTGNKKGFARELLDLYGS